MPPNLQLQAGRHLLILFSQGVLSYFEFFHLCHIFQWWRGQTGNVRIRHEEVCGILVFDHCVSGLENAESKLVAEKHLNRFFSVHMIIMHIPGRKGIVKISSIFRKNTRKALCNLPASWRLHSFGSSFPTPSFNKLSQNLSNASVPPSQNKITPLIPREWGLTINTRVSAISTGSISFSWPYRVGIGSAATAIRWLGVSFAVMAVSTLPGATALIRTPSAAQDAETRRVHRARAYLEATYIG